VAEVLTGAQSEKVLKWDHHLVSTYGIGKEHSRGEWILIGRELVRLGYVRQLPEKFNVLQVTDGGRRALKEREPVVLAKPITPPKVEKLAGEKKYRSRDGVGGIDCDETLFDRLRRLRKKIADERGLPAYIIFSDVSLRQMARYYPTTAAEFARINGVGERKLADFGKVFMDSIAGYLNKNPRKSFSS
jgi:ATP-dependent DNA helicase RecQ